ncbi:RNA-guided endonuclease InsQ/TnpB family protein [Brasilonema octagenarum]|uniref:Transposase n=1 Tax=Brasilonema octagenarum UFV-OR1 TaxID=417115 RepID=A0ABX1MD56_9CYAN|nr:RNA-guided endonuclease TnpB family protein [Brasilonema octagenarum]NMF63852.1 transposase [Brasilonema octagenarum UFV-OR1]
MLSLTYSYRIYPDAAQEARILTWMESCRKVYNYALRERKDWISSRKCAVNACSIRSEYIIPADTPYPDYYKQQNALTPIKKDNPELQDVQSQVLQDALKRLDKAFKFMMERGFGFPRFKKFGQYRSFVFPQFKSNPVTGFQIKLPKIGAVPINLHRPIPDGFVVKQVRVINKASGWYAQLVLQSDVSVPDILPNSSSIGIDVGLEKFLAASNGLLVERPRFFNSLQSELRWLQRKLKNKTKGSANYRKVQHKIRRLYERIYDTRKQFHINTAHALCNGVGMVFAEDVNLKATSRGMLAKHCLDEPVRCGGSPRCSTWRAAWGSFLEILSWVCWKRRVYFAKVNPNGTSQTCPQCGNHTGKKKLFERVHVCDECGYTTDRDVAAAMVVEQRGLAAAGLAVKLPVEVTLTPGISV